MSRSMRAIFLAGALLAMAILDSSAQPQRKNISATVSPAVPADAAMFLRLRVGDLAKSDAARELRVLLTAAGTKALATYVERFPISLANVEEAGMFGLPGPAERRWELTSPILFVRFSQPVEHAKLAAFLMPRGTPREFAGSKVIADDAGSVMLMPDPKSVMIGEPKTVQMLLERPPAGDGSLKALIGAPSPSHLTFALDGIVVPPQMMEQVPPPLHPLLKAKTGVATVQLATDIELIVTLQFADESAAIAGEKAARDGANMLREKMNAAKSEIGQPLLQPSTPSPASWSELPEAVGRLIGLAAIGKVDDMLANFPVRRDGVSLRLQVNVPMQSLSPALLAAGLASAGYWFYEAKAAMPEIPAPPRPVPTPRALDVIK